MNDERTPLSTYIEPEITGARIARQWAAMESRGLPGPETRSRMLLAGLYVAPLCAALGLFAWFGWPQFGARSLALGASVESAEQPVSVHLRDGSSVELAAQTRLRMLRDQQDAVEFELLAGRANFDVTHVEGRKFTVSLGGARVRVVGTRFELVRSERPEGALLQVSVSRGVVEVRRSDQPGDVRKLTAGETWSALIPRASKEATAANVLPASAANPEQPKTATPETVDQDEAEAAMADDSEAYDATLGDHEPEVKAVRGHAALLRMRARSVFQRANLARRAGQVRDAESAYAELLRRFPRDGRAGVSAFELGRIRMDVLGDPSGAADAFGRALRLSPDASFREDALARIVVARDAMGQTAACRAARDRYLAGYPRGVHAVSLAARCK